MKGKMPYETLDIRMIMMQTEDIVTASIVDNDGDYRDWETDGEAW